MIYNFIFLVIAYLLGSFPTALVVGKLLKGIDVREHGSKNLGSTNAVRVMGFKIGIIVFIIDLLKPTIVLLMVKYNLFSLENLWHPGVFGIASAIGHCYPIFANFKGGKCVASSLGIVLCLSPIPGIIGIIVFVLNLVIHGYVSVGSTMSGFSILISYIIQLIIISEYSNYEITTLIIYIILLLIIIYRHLGNYKRLFKGEEKSFKKKKGSLD